MPSMTYRYALSDCEKMLEQVIANRKFPVSQILFWILEIADSLKAKHVVKIDSGAFIHEYNFIQVITNPITNVKYINLPSGIFDINLDDGVNFLSYDGTIDSCSPPYTSVTFSRTTAATSKRLYWTEEEKPSPSNPYFLRLGNELVLLGIECITVTNLWGGFYSTFDPTIMCNLDDEFDFPQELYHVLKMQLLDLARFGLAIPNSRKNDGNFNLDDELSDVPKQKLQTAAQDNSQEQSQ